MMSFSTKFGDEFLLNYFIKTNPFGLATVEDLESAGGLRPPPAMLYISLHTAAPTWDYATALSNELSGLNYSRAPIAPDSTTSPTRWYNVYDNGFSGQREATNKANIVFPAATGSNWPGIGGFGIWRVASGGAARDYIASAGGDPTITVTVGNHLTLIGGTSPPSAIGGIRLAWATLSS